MYQLTLPWIDGCPGGRGGRRRGERSQLCRAGEELRHAALALAGRRSPGSSRCLAPPCSRQLLTWPCARAELGRTARPVATAWRIASASGQRRLRQLLDRDLLVPGLGFAAAVNLKAEDAELLDLLVRLGVIDGLMAVDRQPDAFALAAHLVIIPVALPQYLVHLVQIGFDEHLVAPRFVVEKAPPAFAHVSLVAADFIMVGHPPAAELHAAVDEAVLAGELEFYPEHEVGITAPGAEEFIVRHGFRQRAADERARLDPPGFVRVAFPAFEGFAVADQLRPARRLGRNHGQRSQEENGYEPFHGSTITTRPPPHQARNLRAGSAPLAGENKKRFSRNSHFECFAGYGFGFGYGQNASFRQNDPGNWSGFTPSTSKLN